MGNPVKYLLCLVLLCGFVIGGCSSSADEAIGNADDSFSMPEGESLASAFGNPLLAGMKGIAENNRLQLYVDDQTAEIAVLDKNSGEIWRSNPEDRESDKLATGVNKDLLSAQARINFFNMTGQDNAINSYTDSTAHQQMAFETISDGIRVTYQFGTAAATVDNLPQKMSKARFEELSSQLDKTGQRALLIGYIEDKANEVYVRNEDALKGLQLKRILDAFEAAGYTAEDLAQDIQENDLNQTRPTPRVFYAAIEYTLDGDSLVVKVPSDSIRFPDDYPMNRISILNFFGAGGVNEQGSLFVPDGSGALIHFNNGKTGYPAYQQDVYGKDLTMDNTDFLARDQKIRMPVFGLIKDNSAFLGIIEEGAPVAMINADVSGKLNSYNYVYPSFYVVQKDSVRLSASDQNRELPKFQEEPMKTDFVVRYAFLNGKDANYQGMAKYYQQYLENKQMLPQAEQAASEDTLFYLQLIGSIDKRKHMLGVPYQTLEPLTTFKEAESILSQLKDRNIDHIKLKYSGWFNGGLDHKTPTKLTVDDAVGGKKGLADFLAYVQNEGIQFFPDVALLSATNPKGFNESRDAARRLTEVPAAVYPIDLAMNRRDRDRTPDYVVSPRIVEGYVDSTLDGLTGLGISRISLRDLADQLNSDYRKKNQIDRSESEEIAMEALKTIHQSRLKMMADGGNAYAFPYLTDITDAPLSNSNLKLEDEAIPFYQMVIRGYIDYTGAPYNLSTYTNARQYVLKCLEYGSNISFTWSYQENQKVKETEYDYLYATHYLEWIDLAEQMYAEVNQVLKNVQHQRIVSHEKLGEGVFRTTYENGFYTIVNYNRSSVSVDGMTIEAESFATGGGQS